MHFDTKIPVSKRNNVSGEEFLIVIVASLFA